MNRNPELEQFFSLFHALELKNNIGFLSLCSKIEAHVPGLLTNIIGLLEKTYTMGLLTPEIEEIITHRHQTPLGIFNELVELLVQDQDSIEVDILLEMLETPDEIYDIIVLLIQKNIINPVNQTPGLFYFLFCNPEKNLINFIPKLGEISLLTSETYMEWSYDSNFKRHFESYLALIALSQQNGHQSQFPFILSRAHQPFAIAQLLCTPSIAPFFQFSEVLNPLSLSHLPELSILLLYLEKNGQAPKPFVEEILQRLIEQEQINMDLVNLKNALLYLFKKQKLETFEFYPIFWQDLDKSFILSKIYHLLALQNQASQFDKIIGICQFIEAEKLLEILENMKSQKIKIEDQLYFLQKTELLENIEEHFQYFKALYSQNVLPSDLGCQHFARFLTYHSTIINEMLIFFKKQGLLTPEFCSKSLTPQFINHLIEHEILTLLFDISIHEIYNYLLFHFTPNHLTQGFETVILLHQNFLLETENWANNLSAIRVIPDFQIHVKHLFQLAESKQLNQKTFEDFVLRFTPKHCFFDSKIAIDEQKSHFTLTQ